MVGERDDDINCKHEQSWLRQEERVDRLIYWNLVGCSAEDCVEEEEEKEEEQDYVGTGSAVTWAAYVIALKTYGRVLSSPNLLREFSSVNSRDKRIGKRGNISQDDKFSTSQRIPLNSFPRVTVAMRSSIH